LEPSKEIQAPQIADPREIRLRPSRRSMALTLFASFAALGVIAFAPLPLWLRVAFIILWAVASMIEFRAQRLLAANAVLAFRVFDRDSQAVAKGEAPLGLEVRMNAQASIRRGVVLTGCFVAPWFTALRYRLEGDAPWRRYWPRVIPLWPDSLDTEAFRELRVLLKWK
jgi:hypothetical protein